MHDCDAVEHMFMDAFQMTCTYEPFDYHDAACGCEELGVSYCKHSDAEGQCGSCSAFSEPIQCDYFGLSVQGAADCRKWCFGCGEFSDITDCGSSGMSNQGAAECKDWCFGGGGITKEELFEFVPPVGASLPACMGDCLDKIDGGALRMTNSQESDEMSTPYNMSTPTKAPTKSPTTYIFP
jgi:hypothetical protein